MNLETFAGIRQQECGFEQYYDEIIRKLGGPETIRPFLPFDLPTLKKSYEKDRHFNTDITPLRVWGNATGVTLPPGQSTRLPYLSGGELACLLTWQGVSSFSHAECVCILKRAAERLVCEKTGNPSITD